MSQTSQPTQPGTNKGRGWGSAAVVGLVLVALLSLGFAGYTSLNSHTNTITRQQMLTSAQTVSSVQLQTVTVSVTQTAYATAVGSTITLSGGGNGYAYGNYQVCSYYGCYYQNPGYYYYPGNYYGYGYYGYYPPCQNTGSADNVSCQGYVTRDSYGCTLLAITTTSNPYPSYATGLMLEYYTLQNLPANPPQSGAWVTVTGQLYQGYNASPSGASCPTNYIVVSSIS